MPQVVARAIGPPQLTPAGRLRSDCTSVRPNIEVHAMGRRGGMRYVIARSVVSREPKPPLQFNEQIASFLVMPLAAHHGADTRPS